MPAVRRVPFNACCHVRQCAVTIRIHDVDRLSLRAIGDDVTPLRRANSTRRRLVQHLSAVTCRRVVCDFLFFGEKKVAPKKRTPEESTPQDSPLGGSIPPVTPSYSREDWVSAGCDSYRFIAIACTTYGRRACRLDPRSSCTNTCITCCVAGSSQCSRLQTPPRHTSLPMYRAGTRPP